MNEYKLATVTALFTNGTAKVRFDGETAASEKKYSYLASYTSPTIGHRVLMLSISDTYIIIGRVVANT